MESTEQNSRLEPGEIPKTDIFVPIQVQQPTIVFNTLSLPKNITQRLTNFGNTAQGGIVSFIPSEKLTGSLDNT